MGAREDAIGRDYEAYKKQRNASYDKYGTKGRVNRGEDPAKYRDIAAYYDAHPERITASTPAAPTPSGLGALPGVAGTSSAPGAGTSNTAQTDPNLQYLIDQIKARTSGAGTTQRAMDMSTSAIRDAGEGLSKQIGVGAARRGVAGTGAEALQQGKLARDMGRSIAGANAGIALGRESDIDRMLMGSGGIFAAPSNQALQDRSLANQQYATQANLALSAQQMESQRQMQQQQMNMQQQQAILQALGNLW